MMKLPGDVWTYLSEWIVLALVLGSLFLFYGLTYYKVFEPVDVFSLAVVTVFFWGVCIGSILLRGFLDRRSAQKQAQSGATEIIIKHEWMVSPAIGLTGLIALLFTFGTIRALLNR